MSTINNSRRVNNFMETVKSLAVKRGLNTKQVVCLANGLSSTHFALESMSSEILNALPAVLRKDLRAKFNIRSQSPYRVQRQRRSMAAEQSLVYIATQFTEQLLNDGVVSEQFGSAKRLYQYLNWTNRMSKVADSMAMLKGRNGLCVLLINTELHDERGHELYALCIRNDIESSNAQKWQCAALRTGFSICNLLGIHSDCLPLGVRAVSAQFDGHRRFIHEMDPLRAIKEWIMDVDFNGNISRYQQMKCVETNANGRRSMRMSPDKVLKVRLSAFYEAVRSALEDDEVDMIPMVSIVAKKGRRRKWNDFSVDYLLPVRCGDDWVGVVFRDGVPTQALMDLYDITNKALLCDPSFDVDRLSMFAAPRYHRLRIEADLEWSSTESASRRYQPEICESRQWARSPSPTPMVMEMSPAPSMTPAPAMTPPPSFVPTPIAVDALISSIATSFGALPESEQQSTMQTLDRVLIDGKNHLSYFAQFLNGN